MTTLLDITGSACPYNPRMTRVEALALRAAGLLQENCVVVITDGPVIGTAGNTSATEIELQPTSPTSFGLSALVHTTFDNSAWDGQYDIDLGAAGTILALTDNRNNRVVDTDANGSTVHTQWPWHLTQPRDNYVQDCTLTGLADAAANASVFQFLRNRLYSSTLDFTGYANASLSFADNEFISTTGRFAKTGGSCTISRSRVTGGNAAAPALRVANSNTFSLADSNIRGGYTMDIDSPETVFIVSSSFTGGTTGTFTSRLYSGVTVGNSDLYGPPSSMPFHIDAQAGATGGIAIASSTLRAGGIRKEAGSTGRLTVTACFLVDVRVTVGASNGATINALQNTTAYSCIWDLLGPVAAPARNDIRFSTLQSAGINVAATATAGVDIFTGFYTGIAVNQNRTAGTGSLSLSGCDGRGFATVTDNGTTDPGGPLSINRCEFTDCTVIIGDIGVKGGPGAIMQQCKLTGSTLHVSGLAGNNFLSRLEMMGSSLNNGGFGCDNVELRHNAAKTFTAANTNTMANVAFDNVV